MLWIANYKTGIDSKNEMNCTVPWAYIIFINVKYVNVGNKTNMKLIKYNNFDIHYNSNIKYACY